MVVSTFAAILAIYLVLSDWLKNGCVQNTPVWKLCVSSVRLKVKTRTKSEMSVFLFASTITIYYSLRGAIPDKFSYLHGIENVFKLCKRSLHNMSNLVSQTFTYILHNFHRYFTQMFTYIHCIHCLQAFTCIFCILCKRCVSLLQNLKIVF